ncbi:transcriptional regulator Medusa [Cordyceps fumosorosea ARSEF 2679]|uniref:Transcriptional regulator Medusa n=1 Tax=Cordyceps fumosorosea (strain ARSEF 2679) TaxID=1081104 RepID=A0A168B8P4_CORFA|nr:transcriptional regulator Medusa [Cordyceps fumosorosea ARSEF 2679]OAA69775.1 transcriptional regulator Medusa [Cordyceps fumosorosea ARSEF 2679]
MAAYSKPSLPSIPGYDQPRYQDSTLEPYQQPFSSQQADKFAQLNQQAFGSNHAVTPYIGTVPTVVSSCQPSSGIFGTKVYLKISAQYELFSMSSPMPYFFLQFGNERCPMQDVARDTHDGSGFIYSCSADAPQLLVTGCSSSSVPLSLVIEGPTGDEISRTTAGHFQYLEGSGDGVTRPDKLPKTEPGAPGTHAVDQPGHSPKSGEPQINPETATNSYDYSSQPASYATTFPPQPSDMITYRSNSFADSSYGRRSLGWNGFNTPLGSTRNSIGGLDGIGRSSLTPSSMSAPPGNAPALIRTSTITSGAGAGNQYAAISLYATKAVLKIQGKLDSMVDNWTHEEWENRRRIVVFRKSQSGSTLTADFRAVPVNERPQNSICVSCIYWAEKNECFVTSVDTIQLLEQLVAAPNRFSVEEKNRIRRNLEGFHPLTVSKAKPDSEEFFKLIMGFPNPKPRNIEKDVKVFPWKVLEGALKKIIGKYSASPSSQVPPGAGPPGGMNGPMNPGPYGALPTPPTAAQHISAHHGEPHGQYSITSGGHHDAIPSPRSLSGSQAGGWTPYTTASYPSVGRTLSPGGLRNHSPHHQAAPPPMRINTSVLPAVSTYDTRSAGGYGGHPHSGLHTPISQHPTGAASTPPRWDAAPASYAESYSGLSSQHGHAAPPMYNGAGYSDGGSRA